MPGKTLIVTCLFTLALLSQGKEFVPGQTIPPRSKVFIAPIAGGFDTYLAAGFVNKKVPLVVVTDRTKADYEITGIADTERAGWAKMLFWGMLPGGSPGSREDASMKMVDLETGRIVFAYAVRKATSAQGKKSAAEACAKHLKEIVKNKK